jgi:hypothetical protein
LTQRERLGCAALISLALHGVVISATWISVPETPAEPRAIVARLAPPSPEIKAAISKPRARAAARRPARAPAPAMPSPAAAAAPLTLPEPEPELEPDYAPESAATAEMPEPDAPEPPQRIALAAESSASIARGLPRRGRITYSVMYGEGGTQVGQVVQSWEAEPGAYRIFSEAETSGMVELFRPQRLRYMSRGSITREGLRPESFLMSRTRRGQTEVAQARFDWSASSLVYGLAREPKDAPLPPDAQDFMSFVYQFVLLPPAPGRYRVPITTGSRFELYDIEVGAEQTIETPIGALRALPVKQLPAPGRESVEIWLAAEYHHLPVRIRHYDREGQFSGEQIVREIRISEE